jgi:thiol:disulfide interchange protein
MRQIFRFQSGVALGDWVLYGLIVVVMLLGSYAISRSVDAQQKVAVTFVGWHEDKHGYNKALADQKETHKPMLVYIYAPWCPHCKDFAAQVLSDKRVQQFMQNYPHVRIAPDHGKAEEQIMEEYGAKGYPSFYVVMPDQRRIQIDTHTAGEHPRLKTPEEFIKSVLQATDGA